MRGTVAVLLAAALWGTTGTAAALAPGVGPLAVGAAAMGVGGLLQAAVAGRSLLAHRRALADQRRLVMLGALAVAVYPLAFYTSMRLAGVAVGTVITIGCAPVIAAIVERVVEHRPLSRRWALSALAGVGGVLALTLAHRLGSAPGTPALVGSTSGVAGWRPALGIALGVIAAATYALYSWSAARVMRHGLPSRTVMGAMFGLGGLALIPVLITSGAAILTSTENWAVVVYLAVVPMFLGYLLFGRGLATVSASDATTLSLLEPAVATAIAVLLLGERLPALGWLGMTLVLVGLIALTLPPAALRTVVHSVYSRTHGGRSRGVGGDAGRSPAAPLRPATARPDHRRLSGRDR